MKQFPRVLFALVLIGGVALAIGIQSIWLSANSDTVRLQTWPGNDWVQMFHTLDEQETNVTVFDDGTTCTRLSRERFQVGDVSPMIFLHLECNGVTGYVNEKWVR